MPKQKYGSMHGGMMQRPHTLDSSFDSDAQQALDRHNCRHCGQLVCGECSLNERPAPSMGVLYPVRICDRCLLLIT
jgi:hypothetical protein